MKLSDLGTTQNLTLDKPFVNPRLARRLPPTTAFRYHALPVAKDDGCITVAMADPDDAVARAEVAAASGSRLYAVQTDPKAIDGLLAEVWPEESRHRLRLLVYHQASPIAGEVLAYARYLSDLVWGHLGDFQTVAPAGATLDDLTEAACGYDLVVLIVIAADHSSWSFRRLPGELGIPLLRWTDRPVLIAKPVTESLGESVSLGKEGG
jgi:hypothetical protein